VVLVALDGALDAVEIGATPGRVVTGVGRPGAGPRARVPLVACGEPAGALGDGIGTVGPVVACPTALETVRLEVALQHHPESELVGEVQQARMRRVVAGADRVDVEALHAREVFARMLLVEDAPAIGVRLVTVHAVEDEPATVCEQLDADDLDGAEAQSEADLFGGRRDLRLVEPRRFGGPGFDTLHSDRRH
jgi:hypothetical protein